MAYVPFSQHRLNGAQWFMPQFCTKAQNVPLLIHSKARRLHPGLVNPVTGVSDYTAGGADKPRPSGAAASVLF